MASISRISVIKASCYKDGEINIFGSGFTGASQVYFVDAASKKIPASKFTVVNDGQINCLCPPFSQEGIARGHVVIGSEEAVPVITPPPESVRATEELAMSPEMTSGLTNFGQFTKYGNEFEVM
ncbi:hypothetical protein PAQ31011_03045 [Pandoraea aquatica]|uniref:IPT/TIG domain-containing protein n=1 Tax=Pandoraea aquatica TaxID=2508290 RepID=A0A5E4W2K3_9BURK|nr:IPT/TIG domain-containing protein [Pandoraea aquatica]VVE18922.1 hypothetical protein PAQ31011_03045 [Pandoraea aquatica]